MTHDQDSFASIDASSRDLKESCVNRTAGAGEARGKGVLHLVFEFMTYCDLVKASQARVTREMKRKRDGDDQG